jgi:hypothetical protein
MQIVALYGIIGLFFAGFKFRDASKVSTQKKQMLVTLIAYCL